MLKEHQCKTTTKSCKWFVNLPFVKKSALIADACLFQQSKPKKIFFLPQCLELEIKSGLENSFRPTPGFFEPREPPKQLSYLQGKIIVSNIHPSLHRLFISFELFSFHQADNFLLWNLHLKDHLFFLWSLVIIINACFRSYLPGWGLGYHCLPPNKRNKALIPAFSQFETIAPC